MSCLSFLYCDSVLLPELAPASNNNNNGNTHTHIGIYKIHVTRQGSHVRLLPWARRSCCLTIITLRTVIAYSTQTHTQTNTDVHPTSMQHSSMPRSLARPIVCVHKNTYMYRHGYNMYSTRVRSHRLQNECVLLFPSKRLLTAVSRCICVRDYVLYMLCLLLWRLWPIHRVYSGFSSVWTVVDIGHPFYFMSLMKYLERKRTCLNCVRLLWIHSIMNMHNIHAEVWSILGRWKSARAIFASNINLYAQFFYDWISSIHDVCAYFCLSCITRTTQRIWTIVPRNIFLHNCDCSVNFGLHSALWMTAIFRTVTVIFLLSTDTFE